MAAVNHTDSPKITDTILINIECPDVDGCFDDDPYKVDSMTIYFVERDFLGLNWGEYTTYQRKEEMVKAVIAAQKALCEDESLENTQNYSIALTKLEASSVSNTFYYKDRVPVQVIGSADFPAWIGTDIANSLLTKIEEDEDGNAQNGRFQYEWNPKGSIREGDFFVCWTWTPNPAGDSLSAHVHFKVQGDSKAVTSIPTHQTNPDKYEDLLERYLPEMYKSTLTGDDITPEITLSFNKAIADGFTFTENFANQIIDLFDANVLHESLLPYLSNLFNLKPKSGDPTLWRRQIKEAVPLFKKKGSIEGLKQAFAQAGMVLNSVTQYWQIVSKYTWEESFVVSDSFTFTLEKDLVVTPVDDNFKVWVRYVGEDEYTSIDTDFVSFDVGEDCVWRVTWNGNDLNVGDILRVRYLYNPLPAGDEEDLQEYVLTLPLADLRDETDQEFPPKNWNVRLIEENDPMFAILIPVKHPFHDWLIFGYIRTEFAYGENIYNMDEYNGSTRPSNDACFIDKQFRDPCGACLSSKYSVDVSLEELSNDRILEAQDILREYTPFHAQIHSIAFGGVVNEFVPPPTESVDFLVSFDHVEHVLSGQANPIFHRCIEGGLSNWLINREDLADKSTVQSGKFATGYNLNIKIVAPDVNFEDLGIGTHVLEVLAPSANAGTYQIGDLNDRTARVTSSVNEPLNEAQFTFKISNIVYGNAVTTITQDDLFVFSDDALSFAELGVKTNWDVENIADYTGGSWKVSIPAYSATPYEIKDIINGKLILIDNGSLPTTSASAISYTLLTDLDDAVDSSTTGVLTVYRQGYVDLNDSGIVDINDVARIGYFLYYDNEEYEIVGFEGSNFWIKGYTDGNVGGATVETRKLLCDNKVGQFGYQGLRIETLVDHEAEFEIVNGENPPLIITDNNNFKENYLFQIGSEFYGVSEWDGVNLTLNGKLQNWGLDTGTNLAYSIIHFEKKQVNVQFTVFDHLDRDGHDPIIREIFDEVDQNTAIVALSANQSTGLQENSAQDESISFTIQYKDGTVREQAL